MKSLHFICPMIVNRCYEDIKDCHFVGIRHGLNDRRLSDQFSIGLPIAFFRLDLTESVANIPFCMIRPVDFTELQKHNMSMYSGVIQNSEWIKGPTAKAHISTIIACDDIMSSRYVISLL